MRTRINVTFTAGTRAIDTGITDLTIEDIRLIVNETQKKVLCSSMQKDLIASVTSGVVTYASTLPVIASGDDITFEIDKGEDYPAVAGLISEIASGKAAIASAINAKGGTASATESFAELAEAVEDIPNYSDMVKLAGIIAGGNYNKNALQGHNANVKYGKTEIVDNVGAFKNLSYAYMFQSWDLLQKVTLPSLTDISVGYTFRNCSALQNVTLPSLTIISGQNTFTDCSALQNVTLPSLTIISGYSTFTGCSALRNVTFGTLTAMSEPFEIGKSNLRSITIGQDTNINLPFQKWTATNVIAEGQSGIDELNSNIMTNLVPNLYLNGGKTLRLGAALYDVLTTETKDAITDRGWTLQRG